jgi:YHS domain-containing protein
MPDIQSLLGRIDLEFDESAAKLKKLQSEQLQSSQDRDKRLQKFVQASEGLREIWKPRLEALAKKFGDRVNVKPVVEPSRREATFAFKSDLANIQLRISVATDSDATKVVFSYDLKIVPILMQFESHSEVEFPIDAIDREKLTQWIDDRIVTFVRTYLSLHENEYYLKGHMVVDPVNSVRFPKHAAAAMLERDGKTYYFVSDETRQQFEKSKEKPAVETRRAVVKT